MPLSWNEIRARAGQFSSRWKNRGYEKGETADFYHDFFEVFGRKRRDVNIYFEKKVKLQAGEQGFIDLFWPGTLLVEQKSIGRNLTLAKAQATDYYLGLKDAERPRYILLSDFQSFELLDLETGTETCFALSALTENIRAFGFIAGYHQELYKDQPEVNIEAASLMGNLHERLEESGYKGVDLEKLLVRLMFCLFADDTGIFMPDSFLNLIENKSKEDGADLGPLLIHLFQVLDTPENERQKTLDEDLASFPYVNGKLFSGAIRTPSFNSSMREALLQCCRFKWSKVSPALFGSLFQMVMLPQEQRKGGAHYTSESNILKTIHPLFLDELREELTTIKSVKTASRKAQLEKFQAKLSSLKFLDPACGCGNFLILAYRELRLLELELLEALYPPAERQLTLDISHLSKVDVDQFYGIEIEEFPAHIAEAAMWLTDHQMNMRVSESFGQALTRLPLKKSAHITHGNALTIDWKQVVAPKELNYILGNPPFIGKHLMSQKQDEEINRIFHGVKSAGVLDYVAAWYMKAAQFIQGTDIKVAFVSTNSITQGEQVATLWQPLLDKFNIHIFFAHRTFKWTIDEKKAKGMKIAAVYCVIIGFQTQKPERAVLFDYEKPTAKPHRLQVSNINPYLVDAHDIIIGKRTKPLCDVPEMSFGNKPVDDGNFMMTETEKAQLLTEEPQAKTFVRPLLSTKEFLHGEERWCLWLENADLKILKNCPLLLKRVDQVKKFRLASKKAPTREAAKRATLFAEIRQTDSNYLFIPRVSSENRIYVPFGFFTADNIVSDTAICLPNATLYHFGVLTSLMHMDWMRVVCGRMKSDYRYSNTLVYNNFPWPDNPSAAQIKTIEEKAQAVLDVRVAHKGATLADLYDPLTMPPDLLKAHAALDRAVEKAYRAKAFGGERERVEYLFTLYAKLSAPLDVQPKKPKPRRKKLT